MPRENCSRSLVDGLSRLALALIVLLTPAAAAAARYALLVGVSSYPSLEQRFQLHGPANDVPLLRSVLLQRGFRDQDIRVLADQVKESQGDPTRSGILNELKTLAGKVQKGDFVFLAFAGHGSQQPAQNLGPANPEPDGLDEVFLPRDVGKWSGANQAVENAIVDDELGAAITAIRNRGAFVWAVFDTCHSGTITRGIEDPAIRYREVRPQELGVPAAALDKAAQAAAKLFPRGTGADAAAPMSALQTAKANADAGGFVAFYAAQSWELTPEAPMPANLDAGDPRKHEHGVFSYSVAEALAMNPTLTYRQLGEQILHRYRAQMRGQPTPLYEGTSLDAPVFGTQVGPQILQWRIEHTKSGLMVPAGTLHRLGDGAIFSVVANPGDPDSAALGFVQAGKVELLQSAVTPIARDGKPALDPSKLPAEAYARLVQPNASLALRVSLPPMLKPDSKAQAEARAVVQRLSKQKVDGLAASWVGANEPGEVRLLLRDEHLWFLPATAELVEQGPHKTISIELANKSPDQVAELTVATLRSIARATSLLKLATMTGGTAVAQGVNLRLAYERQGKSFEIRSSEVPALRQGDKLKLSVNNTLSRPVDVNVLLIDSRYGIQHVMLERFEPRSQLSVDIGDIDTTDTSGREGIVTIVTEAQEGQPQADFRFLSQPTLAATRGGGQPLMDLFEAAGFAPERTRGLSAPARTLSTTSLRLFSWDALAK